MEIILHAHHAEVTESLREQAEAAVIRLAKRLHRVANAIVRFVGDGDTRRVEIVLQRARARELFVHADARAFAPARTPGRSGVGPLSRHRAHARAG